MTWLAPLLWFNLSCSTQPTPQNTDATKEQPIATLSGEAAGDAILAKVGKHGVVTESEFRKAISRIQLQTDLQSKEARTKVLTELAMKEVLFQRALEIGLARDPSVKETLINHLLKAEVHSKISKRDFSKEELVAYYESHKEDFQQPDRVEVRRIFKSLKGKEKQEVEKQMVALRRKVISKPATFSDVARAESEDSYRANGGHMGWIKKTGRVGLDEEVLNKAFATQVGNTSKVFEADGGLNILRIENRRERRERSFEQVKHSVQRALRGERLQERQTVFIEELTKDMQVEINDEALMNVEIAKSVQSIIDSIKEKQKATQPTQEPK